jgi:N-acetyl-1-D-myo-inositol-2-amino-2-deoxy-alpha-D-glucopyranoside deacetylase
MSETERVLFVHAHPDDESISTGGTLATLVDRGAGVTVLTCTRGERGEVIPADLQYALSSPETLAGLRELELRKALGVLGVTDHRFLGDSDARWSGRPPRRYVDSGMQWGSDGRAEPVDELDPASLTAAEFGDVAADIAAVILDVRPDAVVSYDAEGGYGHPDHVRAHEAAQRAAEVYGVPFYEIENDGGDASLSIDVGGVLDRKRAALEAYRSQIEVDGDNFALSNGESRPIGRTERFRRTNLPGPAVLPFARRAPAYRAFVCVVALVVGFAAGGLLTVFHQSPIQVGKTALPLGLVVGLVLIAALLIGLRALFETRIVAFFAAVGIVGIVGILSLQGPGGTVLVPNNTTGLVWAFAPTVIAVLVLAWPNMRRRSAAKIEEQNAVKGPPHP